MPSARVRSGWDRRQARFAEAVKQVPLGRIGTSADVAGAIAHLIGADYGTSTIMPVDGGFTVARDPA